MRRTSRMPIALLPLIWAYGHVALGAQTDISISTAAPSASPRILGQTLIGSKPGSSFLHTVSATGQSPLTFAATGLPGGLVINASSGTIEGTTPAAGSYPISITVTNGAGSATATLTLNSGGTLALTPPMGWNSYDSFGANVKESDVVAAAKAMKSMLQPYGWNTVVIDYLWYDPEQTIDANGRWLPASSKYPSATGAAGFKSLADQIHGLGLNFGIHLMRGIPRKAFTQNTPIVNSTYTASQAGNSADVCSWDTHMYGVRGDTDAGKAWYDSIYAQYAAWGVDFVKVDDMMNPYGGNVLHTAEVQAVAASIAKTGRSIVLSLSPGPNQPKDMAILNANANMWRTVNDFWDTNGLSTIADEFTTAYNWSVTSGATPGHWPDADMLPLGTIGTRACAFTHNQQVTVMTLWAIMPSPLMFGGQVTKLSGDTWTTALLTNEEVLAVNQDALGSRGKRITQQGTTEVWSKDLSGGRTAIALFNRGTQDATVTASFSQLGVTGTPAIRDLWHRADVTGMTTGISVNVPHEGALMYTLEAPGGAGGGSGTGGAGGGFSTTGGAAGRGGTVGAVGGTVSTGGGTPSAGGTSGLGGSDSGGAANVGGLRSTSGAPASGGGSIRGGASTVGGMTLTGGATALSASGGQVGLGGAAATSGARAQSGAGVGVATGGNTTVGGVASTGTPASGNDSGCSCTVPSSRGATAPWFVACGVALLALRRRRCS